MTDYNDGKWHGWNGGECPVHPETIVEAIWDDGSGAGAHVHAGEIGWGVESTPACAFRVVKAYREPRTFWAVGKRLHDSKEQAEEFRAACHKMHPAGNHLETPIVKLIEALE